LLVIAISEPPDICSRKFLAHTVLGAHGATADVACPTSTDIEVLLQNSKGKVFDEWVLNYKGAIGERSKKSPFTYCTVRGGL
jgi:hypothetical protein